MLKRVGGLLAALAMTCGLLGVGAGSAQAQNGRTASGGIGIQCTQIWQYVVWNAGNMTNAESGGTVIGSAQVNDIFNVRFKGNPRYYGFNTRNGVTGWILAGNLSYTGNTWCA